MSVRLGGLAVDGLSAVLLVTLAVVLVAVLVFSAGERYGVRFYGLMLLFAVAMAVTVTATDLLMLLMGWEVMGAMSYALIGYVWSDAERVRSADVAFLTTRAADMGRTRPPGSPSPEPTRCGSTRWRRRTSPGGT